MCMNYDYQAGISLERIRFLDFLLSFRLLRLGNMIELLSCDRLAGSWYSASR